MMLGDWYFALRKLLAIVRLLLPLIFLISQMYLVLMMFKSGARWRAGSIKRISLRKRSERISAAVYSKEVGFCLRVVGMIILNFGSMCNYIVFQTFCKGGKWVCSAVMKCFC